MNTKQSEYRACSTGLIASLTVRIKLYHRYKLQTDGRVDLDFAARIGEHPGRRINFELDHIVGYLVQSEQVLAGGVNAKVARHNSARRELPDFRERVLLRVDGKHSDGARQPVDFAGIFIIDA